MDAYRLELDLDGDEVLEGRMEGGREVSFVRWGSAWSEISLTLSMRLPTASRAAATMFSETRPMLLSASIVDDVEVKSRGEDVVVVVG